MSIKEYAKAHRATLHDDNSVVVNHGSFDNAVAAIRPVVQANKGVVVIIHSDGWSKVTIL